MQDYFEHFSQKIIHFLHLYAIFLILEGLLIEFEGKFLKYQVTTLWIIARMDGIFFRNIIQINAKFPSDQSSNSNF